MVELILQAAVAQGQRLLVCAPSNVAVDNILERVASAATGASSNKGKGGNKAGLRMVRLGHPARLSAQTILYSLEALVAGAEGTGIVHEVRKELAVLEKRRPRDKGERRAWRGELRALRREVRQREERVVSELLKSRDLVFATCVGAASKVLKEERFDLVVIDEAAQALEPACWIPLLKAPRAVLAGDHKQLAPTVKSPKAERMGLGVTLFDRLMAAVGGTHSRLVFSFIFQRGAGAIRRCHKCLILDTQTCTPQHTTGCSRRSTGCTPTFAAGPPGRCTRGS